MEVSHGCVRLYTEDIESLLRRSGSERRGDSSTSRLSSDGAATCSTRKSTTTCTRVIRFLAARRR